MIFSNVKYAYLFWLVPLLVMLYIWTFRSKRKALESLHIPYQRRERWRKP